MSKVTQTSSRKSDHIRINLEEDVSSGLTTGLERWRFPNQALPELDLQDIRTDQVFLKKSISAPLLISSMTGGTESATQINQRLAEAAQHNGIAMGVGSQRAAIEDPKLASSFAIRKFAPDILLFANLGAVQLNYGYDLEQCTRAVEMIAADALVLHLNALQEALQPEGDTNFTNLLQKISEVASKLPVPVIVKEVGWGISGDTARRLVEVGVAVIDVAGAGGTSWSQVELHRAEDEQARRIAATFIDWGIPTADAIIDVRKSLPDIPIIASGGLRNGLDAAKCIALGADCTAMAGPYLRSAAQSPEALQSTIEGIIRELKVTMFACGARDIAALKQVQLLQDSRR